MTKANASIAEMFFEAINDLDELLSTPSDENKLPMYPDPAYPLYPWNPSKIMPNKSDLNQDFMKAFQGFKNLNSYKVVDSNKMRKILVLVPGLNEDEINLELVKGNIQLKVNEDAHKRLSWAAVPDSIEWNVPDSCDLETLDAKLDNGILTITIIKKKPVSKKSRSIKIKRA